MSFMDELRARRQMYLDALDANPDINLDIFEDFYPDKAHFVFELLQNAEDTGATRCKFTLAGDQLEFRHNGKRTFNQTDIESITGISNSQRTRSIDAIGRFGVGFKSVFLYTLTPQIHSGEYSFSITSLVMPKNIERLPDLGEDTVFLFPFNNPAKKSAAVAYTEIKQGLEKLSELTLLFLKNIESISWVIKGHSQSRLYRVSHSEHHIEVIKELYGTILSKSNFLRFSQPARGHESQHVCLAFPLIPTEESAIPEDGKPFHQRFKIAAANPGKVSVFFPAENESSGLRFHIHGPFIPTVDRSSVKDSAVNEPLFEQIAEFAAACLHPICELKLLTSDFLGVLPNPQDNLRQRYEPIRLSIVREMNTQNLTPKHGGGYAPANRLVQAKVGSKMLRELLDKDDLKILVTPHLESPEWVVAAGQNNSNPDKFISSLGVRNWGLDEFVACLKANFDPSSYEYKLGLSLKHHNWLKGKNNSWLQKFYSILWEYITSKRTIQGINGLSLIKLTNGSISNAEGCLFVGDGYDEDDLAKWVSKELFSSGENPKEQTDSHAFLEKMGVRKVGERERIELLLKSRYQSVILKPEIEDIKIFIHYLEVAPKDLDLFRDVPIFKREDGKWARGIQIYIDEPYSATGLRQIFTATGDTSRKPLAPEYLNLDLDKKKIIGFAAQLGAISHLPICEVSCDGNPQWKYLKSVPGKNFVKAVDRDFEIDGFESLFKQCSESLALIVWDTLCHAEEEKTISGYLTATFQKNQKGGSYQAPSQLVYQLTNTAWVPQVGGSAVTPPHADPKLLPPGFPYEPDWKWVEAVKFGNHLASRVEAQVQEEEILRKSLGIGDKQSLEEFLELAKVFAKLPPQSRRKHLNDAQQELNFESPENSPKNPELRAERIGAGAIDAPERIFEIRERSVAIGREEVRTSAKQYLRQQYSNADDVMICQVCQRELPFKLAHGGYYFEAVDFLDGLKLRHDQNYVALCPNHAAMFKHVNNSKNDLKKLFLQMNSDRTIQVDLAGTTHSIFFTETHKFDLSAVIKAETGENHE